jgi:hypothetical protein
MLGVLLLSLVGLVVAIATETVHVLGSLESGVYYLDIALGTPLKMFPVKISTT